MSRVYRRMTVGRGAQRALIRVLMLMLLVSAVSFLAFTFSSAPADLLAHLDGQPLQPSVKAFHEFFPRTH